MNTRIEHQNWSWMKLRQWGIRGAMAWLPLLPVAAWAGGVVTTGTETALRSAMAGGGLVTFACDGTIVLASTITNELDTVLDGTGHQVTISGNNACRVFFVNSNVYFSLLKVAIANGRSDNGAAIYNAGGGLTVQNCVFVGNSATGQAGASAPGSPGTNGCGGALFNTGVAAIANSTFSTNMAAGGAGAKGTNGVSGQNQSGSGGSGGSGYGGAIYNAGEVSLTNCTLNGNMATGGVGGDGGVGTTGGQGGGSGGNGGAGGSSYGGALFNGGVARLANTTLSENASTGGSGGGGGPGGSDGYLPPHSGGDGGNGNAGGSGSGGGIYGLTGQCFLTNCTLAFNQANAGGAGAAGPAGYGQFYSGSPGLSGPAGSASGGGITASGGAFLINVLLASNAPANASGIILDGGHNLSSDYSCNFTSASSLSGAAAPLGPLLDNGGSTPTLALMPGNPAIDAGDNAAAPPADQRGLPRPVGLAADIGAYECGPPAIMSAPQSQSAVLGASVEFSAPAAGYPPLAYEWFFNGSPVINGAAASFLRLTNVQFFQGGTYTLVVTNAFGAVTSSPAILGVFSRTTVTNCTEAALRAAMATGGTVTFASNGVILLASTITNEVDTLLDGTGRQVTISGNGACREFFVNSNVNFTVLNLTIANGLGTNGEEGIGGVYTAPGASGGGGGIYNAGGTVNLTNCTFAGNGAYGLPVSYPDGSGTGYGGAICNHGTLNASRCTFSDNAAVGGPGVYGSSSSFSSPLGGSHGGFAFGGAIYNAGMAAIDHSLFVTNTALGQAGGAGGDGQTLYFDSNQTGGGGGSGGDGTAGALFNEGNAVLVNCTIAWNTATGGAGGRGGIGGIYLLNPHTLGRGYPGGNGGNGGSGLGVMGGPGLLFLTNCTVASNSGTSGSGGAGGGAIVGQPQGSPGSDGSACGGLESGTLINTLLAASAPGGNCCGAVTDLGHNLSSDASGNFTNTCSLNNLDPKLGPLADNGGPTLTMALSPGSPAIDAGDTSLAPTTDQRGFPRPAGLAADIGAFEYGSVMPTIAFSRPSATGLNILGSGNAGRSCRLLASPDMLNWAPVATNQIGNDGTVLFYDPYAPGRACRFYRLVMP